MSSVSAALRDLTLEECAKALGVEELDARLQRLLTLPFLPVATKLGRELEQFDGELARTPLRVAAARTLERLGVRVTGAPLSVPKTGPLLVLANHPGAYDAFALFAALPRDDLRVLVAERPFLRAMPHLCEHLVFVPDAADVASAPNDADRRPARHNHGARGAGWRELVRHLEQGGSVLHFGAGRIEPDPAFHGPDASIKPWSSGAGALALAARRAGGHVVVAVVAGVHSVRAQRSLLVRAAEARGITTLSLLLQLAFPYYAQVDVRVSSTLVKEHLPEARREATWALEGVARDVAGRWG